MNFSQKQKHKLHRKKHLEKFLYNFQNLWGQETTQEVLGKFAFPIENSHLPATEKDRQKLPEKSKMQNRPDNST